MNEQRIRMDQKIQTMATRLSKSLDVNMRKSFLPDERKALRRFSSTEVAQILGVSQDFLRKMFFEDKLDLGMEPEAWRLGRTADEHLKRLERDGLTGRRGRE